MECLGQESGIVVLQNRVTICVQVILRQLLCCLPHEIILFFCEPVVLTSTFSTH